MKQTGRGKDGVKLWGTVERILMREGWASPASAESAERARDVDPGKRMTFVTTQPRIANEDCGDLHRRDVVAIAFVASGAEPPERHLAVLSRLGKFDPLNLREKRDKGELGEGMGPGKRDG